MPVVGASVALICVVAFFATWVFGSRQPDLAALDAARRYWVEHPYLAAPEALIEDLDEPPAELAAPDSDVLAQEQAELDRLVRRVIDSAGGSMRRFALVPARGLAQPGWLTSIFLHFGWMHLLGNLLFLYIVAPLLEDAWGRARFLLFYLAGGLVANLAQYALDTKSNVAIAGASGAIAACMGAFAIRFAAQHVRMAYFIWLLRPWVGTKMVPAWACGAAWFALELLDLRHGGARGVATGAHVGGFVLGAVLALGLKGLGYDKELRTAEEAELDTAHKADLMQQASIAAARGEYDVARENLVELLKLVPGREDAELLLAELDVKTGRGAARLEKCLRRLVSQRQSGALSATLSRVADALQPSMLSTGFALQLAKELLALKHAKHEPMIAPLLEHAATAGGRLAAEADALRARLSGPLADVTSASPPASEPVVNEVQFVRLSAQGLTLVNGADERTVPFERIVAVHAGVAAVEGRRVLLVDLVVRTQPPLALRLTSDDRAVPGLFPAGTPVPQAWRTFIEKLLSVSKATRLHGEQLATYENPAAVTAAWSGRV